MIIDGKVATSARVDYCHNRHERILPRQACIGLKWLPTIIVWTPYRGSIPYMHNAALDRQYVNDQSNKSRLLSQTNSNPAGAKIRSHRRNDRLRNRQKEGVNNRQGFSFKVKYEVCKYKEAGHTWAETVKHFQKYNLKSANTCRQWLGNKTMNGKKVTLNSSYWFTKWQNEGNLRKSHKGGTTALPKEIEMKIQEKVNENSKLCKSRSYQTVSAMATEAFESYKAQNEEKYLQAKEKLKTNVISREHRKELKKFVKTMESDFKGGKTWFAGFQDRNGFILRATTSTKKMSLQEWDFAKSDWLQIERIFIQSQCSSILDKNGRIIAWRLQNGDEVPLSLLKYEELQLCKVGDRVVSVRHHTTMDPTKRFTTVILTMPGDGFTSDELNYEVDCLPAAIMPGAKPSASMAAKYCKKVKIYHAGAGSTMMNGEKFDWYARGLRMGCRKDLLKLYYSDNYGSHNDSVAVKTFKTRNVKQRHFPKNSSLFVQPVDQGAGKFLQDSVQSMCFFLFLFFLFCFFVFCIIVFAR